MVWPPLRYFVRD